MISSEEFGKRFPDIKLCQDQMKKLGISIKDRKRTIREQQMILAALETEEQETNTKLWILKNSLHFCMYKCDYTKNEYSFINLIQPIT
jgi:hypothetical protein